MATGRGIASKAAFRLNKPNLNVDLVPDTNGKQTTGYDSQGDAATNAQRMGPYDQLPFLSESLTEQYEYDDDLTLGGKAGVSGHDITAKLHGGQIELQGSYLGMDNIIAAAMGYEKPSYNNSPSYDEAQSADNPMTGTTTSGSTSTTLEDDSNSQFEASNIGEWVRIADSGDATEGQVRRITANADADNLTITPAWSSDPGAGSDYQIARAFTHTYEPATIMHVEDIDDIYTNYATETSGNNADHYLRFGTMVFDKGVSLWEYRQCMVNSLTFNYNVKEGLKLTADIIPHSLSISPSVNTASSTWDYSASPTTPIHLQERIMGADLVFRLDDYSDSSLLTSADNLPISEFSLTINNNLKTDEQTTVQGLYITEPIRDGFREVTGTITVPRYTSNTPLTDYQADTALMASIIFTGSSLTGSNVAATNVLRLFLRTLKITGHSESISGPGGIVQTYNFKCFVPTATTAVDDDTTCPAVNNASSEIVIQTRNNNPFNAFRAQNGE